MYRVLSKIHRDILLRKIQQLRIRYLYYSCIAVLVSVNEILKDFRNETIRIFQKHFIIEKKYFTVFNV